MSARELITEHLDLWTGAITKKSSSGRGSNGKVELTGVNKLRELILELAVQGKLVDQNPNDEPASMLLKKIDKEKAQLTHQGKLKKPKKYTQVSQEEHPFKIPSSWAWERMHRVFLKITDGTHHSPPNKEDGEFFYVSAKNIKPEGVQLEGITFVTKSVHEEIYSRCNPEAGDLLYIKDGATTGIAAINNLNEPFSMLSSVALLKPHRSLLSNKFLLYCLRSPFFYKEIRAGMTGVAITRVTLKKLDLALIPVPPINEQHRIVQQVDELMALCDRLEQQTSDQLEAHETLVNTLLATLTQSENATELADNWARLAAHFDTLFTTEQSIDKLKQTILQLAVMGRLVEQDAGDEPAETLLGEVVTEVQRLIDEGRFKVPKEASQNLEADVPFTIPKTWAWCSLDQIAVVARGGSPRPIKSYITTAPDGFNWIKIGDTTKGSRLITKAAEKIIPEGLKKTRRVYPGDLILSNSMSFGQPYILDIEGCIHDGWLLLRTPEGLINKIFLYYLLLSPYAMGAFTDSAAGAVVQNLNADKVRLLRLPLPPLNEQKRIVQKVDELTALCDQLKERLNQAGETRRQLAEAVVEGALK